jgi:orotate phosphoribosyltransferase
VQGRVLDHRRRDLGGTSVRESIQMIEAAGATPCGVAIALDRQEKAAEGGVDSPHSAVQQVQQHYGLPVVAIAGLADLLAGFIDGSPALAAHRPAVPAYRERYGV